VRFIETHPGERFVDYGAEWLMQARDCEYLSSDAAFIASKKRMEDLGDDIGQILDSHMCDALVAPTEADVPFDLGGNPAITVPLDFWSKAKKVVMEKNGDKPGMVREGPNIP
jgi:amidase